MTTKNTHQLTTLITIYYTGCPNGILNVTYQGQHMTQPAWFWPNN